MPEFMLDYGSPQAEQEFRDLDSFTQGFIEALFFTAPDYSPEGDGTGENLSEAKFEELAPEALARIIAECQRFQTENRADLDEALDTGRINGYDESAAGRDFAYNRNGHGVGYWSRDLGDIGDKLSDICRKWRETDIYRGDDGKLYLQ